MERKRLKAKVVQVRKHTFQTILSEGKVLTMYRNITIRRTVLNVNLIIINITCLVCLYIGLGLVNVRYSFGIF